MLGSPIGNPVDNLAGNAVSSESTPSAATATANDPAGTPADTPADASADASAPAPSHGKRTLYDQVNNTMRAFDQAYSAYANRMGLSDSALQVLWSIYDLGEGCLQRDVCEDMCIGKQTVNSSVHRLVEAGLLRLEHAASGRGVRLFFTEEGSHLVGERIAPLSRADYEAFAFLPEEDLRVYARVLRAYLDGVNERLASIPAPEG